MDGETWTAMAVLYVERFGLSVLPMGIDKVPLIKWAELQDRKPTVKEILSWPKENLAIITGAISNLVVVDCESREDAEWFWRERGTSSVIVKTRRGYHLYFRHPGGRVRNAQRVEGRYDVRGDGGYVLAPPSTHSEGSYQWVKPMRPTQELPLFQVAWRPETRPGDQESEVRIRDGVAYISKIRAVAGSGGHNDTWRAAQALKDSGLSEAEALLALQEWNRTNADPPWSDRELLHKVRDTYGG